MDLLEYLRLQMNLEGMGLSRNGRLTRLYPSGEELPLVLLARLADGRSVSYINETIPAEVQMDLATSISTAEFPRIESLLGLFRSHGLQPKVGHSKTFVFPERYVQMGVTKAICYPKDEPRIKDFGFNSFGESVYAIDDGEVVLSACVSVRQNSQCAEAWVFTTPQHRRQGLAQIVVAAWAQGVLSAGLIPFYSHQIQNVASANLASKLELTPAFEEICIVNPKN